MQKFRTNHTVSFFTVRLILFIMCLFLYATISAQEQVKSLFDFEPFPQQNGRANLDRLQAISQSQSVKEANFIVVNSIPDIQIDKRISIKLNDNESEEYLAEYISTKPNSDDFHWYGISDTRKSWASIQMVNGETFGEFTLRDRDFRFYTFEKKVVLIETNKDVYMDRVCRHRDDNEVLDKDDFITHEKSLGNNVIRVLVLYTNASEQHMNPSQRAAMLIGESNVALMNSGISLGEVKFEGAGVVKLDNFIENTFQDAFIDLSSN